MSFRSWLSVITIVLIGAILFFARKELAEAWKLMSQVNIWVLCALVPIALVGYIAAGEMIFSYLRTQKHIQDASVFTLARISLELNFVNHVLPSGGLSGISYVNWRLSQYGVSASKATAAQMVRYVAGFAAMATALMVAVVAVTVDGTVNRWIILMSSSIVTIMLIATLLLIYAVKSPSRLRRIAGFITRTANRLVRKASFGKKRKILDQENVESYLLGIHDDYLLLNRDRRALRMPYFWGLVFMVAEVALFFVTFLALGAVVNPAAILIAYSVASFAGFIVVTPGGAGAYEALMVFVLTAAGLAAGDAIAGVLLARVIILITTIGLGYVFYQRALLRYGKHDDANS